MNPVQDYILEHPIENIKQLMLMTHQLLLDSIPQIQYDIKWKVPFYTYKKHFCFLNPKTKYLILGLINGQLLADPNQLLVGEQSTLRHYIIRTKEDIYHEGFLELLMEAVLINENR